MGNSPPPKTEPRRRFHLEAILGAGAFGEVYLARLESEAGFRRRVALKVLHPALESFAEAAMRMRDEARILGMISHRSIVKVLDLVWLGDRWAILMDYVPGADLEQVLNTLEEADESFPVPAALEAIAAVLDALHAAYHTEDEEGRQLSVVHRDIKPSNIRLTADGDVKILDFGVARVNLDTREAETRASGWIGTERYMSPERIMCEGDTLAGDVYAAAATAVELINRKPLGRTPVREDTHGPFVETSLEVIREGLADADSELVERLVQALRASLAAEPEDRPDPQSLSETFHSIARKLPGEGLRTFSRTIVPRAEATTGNEQTPLDRVLEECSFSASGPTGTESANRLPGDSGATFSTSQLASAPGSQVSGASLAGMEGRAPRSRRPIFLFLGAFFFAVAALSTIVLVSAAVLTPLIMGFVDSTPERAPAAQPTPEPALEPGVEPAPEPVPVPGPEPAPTAAPEAVPAPEPAPSPNPRPSPAGDLATSPKISPQPLPQPTPPATAVEPTPAPDVPVVSRAKVVLTNATSVTIRCGGTSSSGSSSTMIRNFPAGTCIVEAVYLGESYQTSVEILRPREVLCSTDGGTLSCQ